MSIAAPYRSSLALPVIGLEAEFKVFIDGIESTPEEEWSHPADFIETPMLKRATKASQLPTGGAIYFDKGVLEIVTPVIEIASRCTARAVRNLWEQIDVITTGLDAWAKRTGHSDVRLEGFSTHYNISFELKRSERGSDRTIQKLALLLAHLLPIPVILVATNRRSTGVGVRPRRDRIEVTLDFTPDPGVMLAATALITGIVREVISWPSYRLEELRKRNLPILKELQPRKHTTRKGWITKDYNFPHNPFETDVDEAKWKTEDGELRSMREIALATGEYFEASIRRLSDPFSHRLLFSILGGTTPSLLELPDVPGGYTDVGRKSRWGSVIEELRNYEREMKDPGADPLRRGSDVVEQLGAPWPDTSDRRQREEQAAFVERRRKERRQTPPLLRNVDLTRSRYEAIFIRLAHGDRFEIEGEFYLPEAMKGWYHAILRRERDGTEQMFSIDQLAAGS